LRHGDSFGFLRGETDEKSKELESTVSQEDMFSIWAKKIKEI
jgi:hypothetical protein